MNRRKVIADLLTLNNLLQSILKQGQSWEPCPQGLDLELKRRFYLCDWWKWAGKSTLMNILANLSVDEGTFCWKKSIKNLVWKRAKRYYTFSDPKMRDSFSFDDWGRNIAILEDVDKKGLAGAWRKRTGIQFQEGLEKVECDGKSLEKDTQYLSGGERQARP